MQVLQKLSILFYLRKTRKSETGLVPIYVRISIDGRRDTIATGISIPDDAWDAVHKQVLPTYKKSAGINKKLAKILSDLEQHFNILQSKNELVSPTQVKENYKTPVNTQKIEMEMEANFLLDEKLEQLIKDYLDFHADYQKAYEFDSTPSKGMENKFHNRKGSMSASLQALTVFANSIFDNKKHKKTFQLAVNEYLLNFLQLCFAGKRSANSLEKMIGRKKRYYSFILYRYKKHDIPLEELQYNFITDLHKYQLTHFGVENNTASKYTQSLKEIIDRAVANGWISNNIFRLFKCGYKQPIPSWPTMEQVQSLQNINLTKDIHNEVRDAFLFGCYTGLSYMELFSLSPVDIVKGFDGKPWINKQRQKTHNEEAVPLLPPAINLLSKYRDYPSCVRRNRLLPVPTNQAYNRALKEIATLAGIDIRLNSHKARFFFANEIAFNNGVELKTVSRMLGHSSIKTTEIYVWANKKNISDSMAMVNQKLFDKDGNFKKEADEDLVEKDRQFGKESTNKNPLKIVHISK